MNDDDMPTRQQSSMLNPRGFKSSDRANTSNLLGGLYPNRNPILSDSASVIPNMSLLMINSPD